jgi:hypothetical protein
VNVRLIERIVSPASNSRVTPGEGLQLLNSWEAAPMLWGLASNDSIER